MLDRLRSLTRGRGADAKGQDGAHSRDELQLATAVLLVQAARLDDHFDESERATIRALLESRFGLAAAEVEALIAEAERSAEEASDFWSFARVVKDRFDHDERVRMIEMLWEVVYADGALHHYEASLLRRITGLIYVSDRESGAARKRVLDRLGLDPMAAD